MKKFKLFGKETPQISLGRCVVGWVPEKRNISFCGAERFDFFFGTFRFADYIWKQNTRI